MTMACGHEYEEDADNIRRLFSANNIVSFSIENIKCSAGSSSGDNYMSVVKRLRIQGYRRNATEQPHKDKAAMTIIVKRQIPSLSRRQLYRCDEAFCNEINAYSHMVPLLNQYIQGQVFPECFYAGYDDLGEIIILEDLKENGFRMQNRLKGLELHYCELVMKQLAKLHAASIAAKQFDSEMFKDRCKQVREIVYCKEAEEFYKSILENSVQESLNSLRNSNADGSLTEPIRLIEKVQYKLFGQIRSYITSPTDRMSVMCHGDLWVNNMMFTHRIIAREEAQVLPNNADMSSSLQSTCIPCDVKFFDLQAMRYTSPVFDILHFLYTSTKRDLRETYTERLLKTYSTELTHHIEEHFVNSTLELESLLDTFSLHKITQEYYNHVLYGLAVCMWVLPAVTFDPDNIPNLDVISEMNKTAKEINCSQKLTPEYHSRLKDLALEFYQNGYLDVCMNED